MSDARVFLNVAGRDAVKAAVKRAESRTAAEVACAIATESGRYDRAEALAGVLLGLTGLGLADALWAAQGGAGAWAHATPLWVLAAGVLLGFLLGSVLASYVHSVRRFLVGAAEMEDEVTRAAHAAFTLLRVGGTVHGTGILVYVSLFEHRVVVLLDEAVRAVAPEGLADRLCQRAVEGLKAGKSGEVLVDLIDAAADELAEVLPPREGDVDELPDRVLILHPR